MATTVKGAGAIHAPAPDGVPSDWPYPVGTKVMGFHRTGGYCIRLDCETHVFEVMSEAQPVEWACGLAQAARCLHCGWISPSLDAETWWNRATPEQIAACIEGMKAEVERLSLAAGELLGIIQPRRLRNFDVPCR